MACKLARAGRTAIKLESTGRYHVERGCHCIAAHLYFSFYQVKSARRFESGMEDLLLQFSHLALVFRPTMSHAPNMNNVVHLVSLL